MSITLTTSIGPVTLKETYEGYEAGISAAGPFVKKVYLCPTWLGAFPSINALTGTGYTPVPHPCPESPNLRCLSATLMPEAEADLRDGGRPQFNLPKIEALYGVLRWESQASDDPSGEQSFPDGANTPYLFMEQSIQFARETIKVPGTAYTFKASGNAIDVPVTMTIGTARFSLVRHYQQTLPTANVTGLMNRLNSSTFLGQPKGQIKLEDARTRRQWTSDGSSGQEVEYVFAWREYDHNAEHVPDSANFDIIQDSTGKTRYPYADLTPLLS